MATHYKHQPGLAWIESHADFIRKHPMQYVAVDLSTGDVLGYSDDPLEMEIVASEENGFVFFTSFVEADCFAVPEQITFTKTYLAEEILTALQLAAHSAQPTAIDPSWVEDIFKATKRREAKE